MGHGSPHIGRELPTCGVVARVGKVVAQLLLLFGHVIMRLCGACVILGYLILSIIKEYPMLFTTVARYIWHHVFTMYDEMFRCSSIEE